MDDGVGEDELMTLDRADRTTGPRGLLAIHARFQSRCGGSLAPAGEGTAS